MNTLAKQTPKAAQAGKSAIMDTIVENIRRRKVIISELTADRLDRLAAQLGMERGELAEALLDRAIRDTDNDLAMGDVADSSLIEPNLCDDYDCTDSLDGMTVAEVLAADMKGPGTIQRQHYVAQCIKDGSLPSGEAAKGETLPPAMENRLREVEAATQRAVERYRGKFSLAPQ